jgi:hypothetical protein
MVGCFVLVAALSALGGEKPSIGMDWYGYVRANASYDQNLTSHGDFVMWVKPHETGTDDPQFNMTHRATRFGFNATSKDLEQVKLGGNLEVDLFGNAGTDNKATFLLRHAYFTVSKGSWKLLAGQSWDLIAPLNPSTLNYTVLWGAGNIQYRRPQISAFYTASVSTNTSVEIAGGVFRTIGNDLTPTFSLATGEAADGIDDGTDAAVPSVQGRLDISSKSASGASIRLGASGLYGQLDAETNFGNSETYESWAACGHLAVSFTKNAGILGEVFTGTNLGSYFGGIVNNSRIDGVRAKGGWASAWVSPTSIVKLSAGMGMDDPNDDDIFSGDRSKNTAIFGNLTVTPVTFFSVGFEVSQWETEYLNSDAAKDLRVETALTMNF